MAIQNSLNLTDSGIIAADGAGGFTGRTVTGTADFIDVANGTGSGGNPTLSVADHFMQTGMHLCNGIFIEKASTTVTSDGATITLSLEQSGGGDLTIVYSDGYYDLDCTPAQTVTLTAGTDTVPQINYIYIPQSTKTLTATTTHWPDTEICRVARVLCQSAASLQTQGPYEFHQWADDVNENSEQGHLTDITYWIRSQNATYHEGIDQTYTITTNVGTPDNVIIETAVGKVLQLHENAFPAFTGTPDVYVINDSVTPYTVVTDLNALLTDSLGVSMSGRYFSLVIWGAVNQTTGDCKLYCNLPSGSYVKEDQLLQDANKYANYTIPEDFKGVGFLISEWKLRHQTTSGGTWTSIEEIDLRGLEPSIIAGGGNATVSEFADTAFRVFDDGDATKLMAFQCSGITTATTRTYTVPNADGTLTLGSAFTQYAPIYASSTTTVSSVSLSGTSGVALISQGVASNPAFGTVVEAGGGTNQTSYTTGDILYASASNTLSKLGIGSSGQALKVSGGVPAWGAISGAGGIVYLSSATASNSAYVQFTSSIDSTYYAYMFVFETLLMPASGGYLSFRTSTDGGSTFDSGASDYYSNYSYPNYTHTTSAGYVGQYGADQYLNGKLFMYNPSATNYTIFDYQLGYYQTTPSAQNWYGQAMRLANADVDAVRFFASSGNLVSGTIKMYGFCTPS